MLEWMIAITAICGAISGIAILYITLSAAFRVRMESRTVRRLSRFVPADGPAELPRARIHRYARMDAVATHGGRLSRVRARRCRRNLAA